MGGGRCSQQGTYNLLQLQGPLLALCGLLGQLGSAAGSQTTGPPTARHLPLLAPDWSPSVSSTLSDGDGNRLGATAGA